jgi:glutamine synthetase adenylyltransferase
MTKQLMDAAFAQAVSAVELALAMRRVEITKTEDTITYTADLPFKGKTEIAIWSFLAKKAYFPYDAETWEGDALIEAHIALSK